MIRATFCKGRFLRVPPVIVARDQTTCCFMELEGGVRDCACDARLFERRPNRPQDHSLGLVTGNDKPTDYRVVAYAESCYAGSIFKRSQGRLLSRCWGCS